MTEPISFTSQTPRFALPVLFAAQAQKEFTINESLARIDMALHPAIEGEADAPPASPIDGETWLVGAAGTGDWSGHAGELASWQGSNWLFVVPREGMRIFDKSAGAEARFDGAWQRAEPVALPTGGTTEDFEARAAIGALVDALVAAGVLSS